MHFQSIDWKKGIILGGVAGVLWGWVALAVNAMSGVFTFENSLLHNLIGFAIGGIIFCIVVCGFMRLFHEWLPFKNILLNAILLSSVLWLLLRIGGVMLSSVEPDRYHLITAQSVQGFVLAVIMGCILGFLWKIKSKEA